MGWPYCIADNKAYSNWDFTTHTGFFDCDGGGGARRPAQRLGLEHRARRTRPPTSPALLWWPYTARERAELPVDDAAARDPGGPRPHGDRRPDLPLQRGEPGRDQVPGLVRRQGVFADWSRDWIATLELDAAGSRRRSRSSCRYADFRHPHDIEMGADGSLYILEWGRDFNYAGSGINPDSGLYRIDYAKGTRTPVARASADKDSGPAPLSVTVLERRLRGPDGDELTYSWNFGDGTTSTEANPTHVFDAARHVLRPPDGDRLHQQDRHLDGGHHRRQHAARGRAHVPIQGGVFDWGDEIGYTVTVTDPEDGRSTATGSPSSPASSTTRAATPTCTRAPTRPAARA